MTHRHLFSAWLLALAASACAADAAPQPSTTMTVQPAQPATLPTADANKNAPSNPVITPQRSQPAANAPSGAMRAAAGSGAPAMPSQAATTATPPAMAGAAAPTTAVPSTPVTGPLMGSCPAGYMPKPGMNTMFPGPKGPRNFILTTPASATGPSPLFLALTGTLQDEAGFVAQSGLGQLTASGWIIVSPVRSCAQESRNCNQMGMDGRVWEPWFDGTIPPSNDAGPDVKFVEDVIRCVASMYPVDAAKIYTGGISAGGSFTNRNLTFNSKLFAGGVPASGNWSYGVAPASPMPMDSSIAIVVWGGPNDTFPGSAPYADETKAAAMYYAAQPNVVTLACSGNHGHAWPTAMTPWLIETLLSHPKGTPKDAFKLKPPPSGLSCVLGAYTDH
jgi:hypothetical protein